jgi:hypothetical protein
MITFEGVDLWSGIVAAVEDLRTIVEADPVVTDDPLVAEGIRYLTRIIACGIPLTVEAMDTEFPQLVQFLSPQLNLGLPAADCCYHWAAVDGSRTYRIHGRRGSARILDIESRQNHMSDLSTWAHIDRVGDVETGPDGAFEVVLSREEKPGNWVRLADGPCNVMVRQYFCDWNREQPAELHIECDGAVYPPRQLTLDEMRARLDLLARWLRMVPRACQQQMARHYAVRPDRLDVTPIEFAFGDLSYGNGHYRCGPDDAVLLEMQVPELRFWSVQLYSHFWDGRDWHLRQTSINNHQASIDDDGRFRAVICHADPGVANWLDAGGYQRGAICARFYRAEHLEPPRLRTVALACLPDVLPPGTRRVTPAERQAHLRARARSVRRTGRG